MCKTCSADMFWKTFGVLQYVGQGLSWIPDNRNSIMIKHFLVFCSRSIITGDDIVALDPHNRSMVKWIYKDTVIYNPNAVKLARMGKSRYINKIQVVKILKMRKMVMHKIQVHRALDPYVWIEPRDFRPNNLLVRVAQRVQHDDPAAVGV